MHRVYRGEMAGFGTACLDHKLILVRVGGGLISPATTADRFPITDKRYFRN